MDGCSSKSCHKIEDQELLWTPYSFEHRTEYVESVHIEEQMPEASVHEHMCHRLPPVKKWRCGIEKGELLHHEFLVERGHYHNHNVDDDNVLYCCGDVAQEASPIASV